MSTIDHSQGTRSVYIPLQVSRPVAEFIIELIRSGKIRRARNLLREAREVLS